MSKNVFSWFFHSQLTFRCVLCCSMLGFDIVCDKNGMNHHLSLFGKSKENQTSNCCRSAWRQFMLSNGGTWNLRSSQCKETTFQVPPLERQCCQWCICQHLWCCCWCVEQQHELSWRKNFKVQDAHVQNHSWLPKWGLRKIYASQSCDDVYISPVLCLTFNHMWVGFTAILMVFP